MSDEILNTVATGGTYRSTAKFYRCCGTFHTIPNTWRKSIYQKKF